MKLVLWLVLAASVQGQTCTRDALKAAAAVYFDAIAQRDPRPLRDVPITENGKPAREFLQTGGKLHFSRQLIDTERCGILTWGVIDETIDGATAPIIIAVRVTVESEKIAAIEVILHRKEERYFNPQAFIDNASRPSAESCQRWEGGVRTECPLFPDLYPRLTDAETSVRAVFTDSGVEIFQIRNGTTVRIDAIVGTR